MIRKRKKFPNQIPSTASMTETTGLMNRPPQDQFEYEAYQQLAGMEPPDPNDPKDI